MSIGSGIRSAVRQGVAQAFEEIADEREAACRSFLDDGEEWVGYETGTTRLPFLLRIMPFVPDVCTRPKVRAIAVTDRRVLVVRIVRTLTNSTRGRMVASIPRGDIDCLTVQKRCVVISTKDGRRFRVKGVDATAVKRLRTMMR